MYRSIFRPFKCHNQHLVTNRFANSFITDNQGKSLLTVAIVGRPNVGKSTLFNRLTKSRMAIVSSVPGTTRDRKEGKGEIAGLSFNLLDTGGFDDRGAVQESIKKQVELSIVSADVILLMLDAKVGVTPIDTQFAKWLRRKLGNTAKAGFQIDNKVDTLTIGQNSKSKNDTSKQIIIVANKTEGSHLSDRVLDTIAETLKLGLGDPVLISASHGDGMADLAQLLIVAAKSRGLDINMSDGKQNINMKEKIPTEDKTIQLAIMGKPNVGKSTLVNAILGEERVIVGPTPGLTRDAIHVEWTLNDRRFRLVDTAGLYRITAPKKTMNSTAEKKFNQVLESVGRLQRSGRPLPGTEFLDPEQDPSQFSEEVSERAMHSALNALRFAQVVLLVVEGSQGRFSHLDMQLARKCLDESRALVIVANKCDAVSAGGVTRRQYAQAVKEHCAAFMKEFGEVPVVACSALQQTGVDAVLAEAVRAHDNWSRRIDTWVLNRWLKDLLLTATKPRVAGRALNVKFITQVKTRPPTFVLFSNTTSVPGYFMRYLRSNLQKDLKLDGVPLRFVFRKTEGRAVQTGLLKQSATGFRKKAGNKGDRKVGPGRQKYTVLRNTRQVRNTARRRVSRHKRAVKN